MANLPVPFGKQELLGFGLIGLDVLQNRFVKIGRFIEKHMRVKDEESARDMVGRMRADVPQDKGNLYNGIRYWQDGDAWVVQAAAVHDDRSGGEDYSGFVEHGTQPGQRGRSVTYAVADGGYHENTSGLGEGAVRPVPRSRTRQQYRTHPGTEAQPFFYDNARDVLEERGADADEVIGLALDEDD
ncbi:hypothetical protein [Bradyrhizobium sp. BR 1433]|uniref:hypothetical protein n=1 Tax=Bradyrhizobium sp. BR 1433 TaxID=3447967 RepID=UPI003EE61A9C